VEPVAAGFLFKGGRHVCTIENLFHFLHQLAAIIWLGGVLAVNVLQVRLGRGHDRAAQASLLHQSDLYGRAVIAPAAAVVLLTGLVLVAEMHLALSDFWVAWGLAAIFLSLAPGGDADPGDQCRVAPARRGRRARQPAVARAAAAGGDPVRQQPAAAVGRVGDGLQADL